MAIKKLKKGDKVGANTYCGRWRRRRPGTKGYVGSKAKKCENEEPQFNRAAARNLCDYFGYLNVAATIGCSVTKVKEIRLYCVKHQDKTILPKLRALNVEYFRNKYGIRMKPYWPYVEFAVDEPEQSWITEKLEAIMYTHLDLGCFQGIQTYKSRQWLEPDDWFNLCELKRNTDKRNESLKSAVSNLAAKYQCALPPEVAEWD